jgi:hypothetical protein
MPTGLLIRIWLDLGILTRLFAILLHKEIFVGKGFLVIFAQEVQPPHIHMRGDGGLNQHQLHNPTTFCVHAFFYPSPMYLDSRSYSFFKLEDGESKSF